MFTETEHLIKEMIDNIGQIKQNRETNSSAVKEQKRIIKNEIHGNFWYSAMGIVV
jgi:hypothetical protein